ncbi:hypothetical protein CANCADRAFT_32211 [Tortispora caseinolytica NRRL Y-17796]|uniref:Chitin biosynthesis protein CHS5 n=1 Tax=Tortispora caseinolytica NRRL Y-17796 TaxID=767744 RepID=A0A1E4TAC4_9ASCO|nr:hypothetical protein CANCADRAFT_32211 [Tortispora caseinolytica NRRL Y-17796]
MVAVTVTVGKLDASLALLLTEDHHLIEFPSVLLPVNASAGSVVSIACECDTEQEKAKLIQFEQIQEDIYETYGINKPAKPLLRVVNVTQTSIVLDWDPIDVATATLKSLALCKNGQRLGFIPNPTVTHSTKLSGLSLDTPYTFSLELTTSAGVFTSDPVTVRTHKMTDLSGITICVGNIPDSQRDALEDAVKRMGARLPLQETIQLDTTHFVCTVGAGPQWEKAVDANIPVVTPAWAIACANEHRIVGVRKFYLNASTASDVSMNASIEAKTQKPAEEHAPEEADKASKDVSDTPSKQSEPEPKQENFNQDKTSETAKEEPATTNEPNDPEAPIETTEVASPDKDIDAAPSDEPDKLADASGSEKTKKLENTKYINNNGEAVPEDDGQEEELATAESKSTLTNPNEDDVSAQDTNNIAQPAEVELPATDADGKDTDSSL